MNTLIYPINDKAPLIREADRRCPEGRGGESLPRPTLRSAASFRGDAEYDGATLFRRGKPISCSGSVNLLSRTDQLDLGLATVEEADGFTVKEGVFLGAEIHDLAAQAPKSSKIIDF